MFFAQNLKFLRKRNKKSQADLANSLNINRTTLSSYESGVQPPFEVQIRISDYFKLSLDALVRYNLQQLSEFQLSELERGFDIDLTGKQLRLLTLTVDKQGRENIEMVSAKAQAGYATGYADPDFIEQLPKYQLPFLDSNKTYRSFQIEGDSMLPIQPGSWVTGSFLQDWSRLKNGKSYIVVTKEDGIVFKVVYKQENNDLLLVSTNTKYKPYTISAEQLVELWQFETYNGFELS